MNYTQTDISNLLRTLPTSKTNAIKAVDIAQKLGYPTNGNQVQTRGLIRFAIQNGHIIVSNTKRGYWVSNDPIEVQEYIRSLESRASDTLQRSVELKQSWNSLHSNSKI